MIQIAPSPVDLLDFQFKLQCRLKVFQNEDDSTFNKACNIVAVASKYGLLFVGTNSASFQVIQLQGLQKYTVKDGDIANYLRRTITLPSKPQHLSVNCDCTKLSVVVKEADCIKAIIYDIPSFLQQNISISSEIRLSPTPGVLVVETIWNPTIPSIYTVCKDDGSLGVYDIKPTGVEINELPKVAGATCMCWSPKGKQIAVGSRDGKITQYKPDLKVAKVIEAPPLGAPHLPTGLQWISNYQFIAVYRTSGANIQCKLLVINCPKAGAVSYINYDDICYSYGSARPCQFYMLLQNVWNVLLVASSNSMEVGVLGFEKDVWTQWILSDSSRAELPLSATKQDTFPIGLSLDVSSTNPVPWGESVLPPAPSLLLLSDHGVLCCFHAVNLKEGAAQICKPPEVVPNSSVYFTEPSSATGTPLPSKPVPINPVKQSIPSSVPPQPAPTTTFSFSFKQTSNTITTTAANTFQQFSSQPQPFTFATAAIPTTTAASTFQQPLSQSQPFTFSTATAQTTTAVNTLQQPSLQSQPFTFSTATAPTTTAAKPLQQPSAAQSQPFTFSTATTPTTKADKGSNQFSTSLFGANVKPTPVTTAASETFVVAADKPSSGSLSNKTYTPQPSAPEVKSSLSKPAAAATVKTPAKPDAPDVTHTIEDTESIIAQMVKEECAAVESELKILLHHGQSIKVDLGTDGEATSLVQNTNNLQEFLDEMNEICQSQSVEVHHLKQELIQTWAWYEEGKSRFNANKDPALITLMRAQPLDGASTRQLEDIRHLLYYLESQLEQANAALDEQWETFQDSCKKKMSYKLPSMEAIYQAMVKQRATIQKQVYLLKDISNRVKAKARSKTVPHLLVSRDGAGGLEEQLRNLTIQPADLLHLQYERVFKRQKQLSMEKMTKLRHFLKSRHVVHVTVNKPQLSNHSLQLTGLAHAPFSPIAAANKKLQPQRLNFVQSTPKPLDSQSNQSANVETRKSQPKVEPPLGGGLPEINKDKELTNHEVIKTKSFDVPSTAIASKSTTFVFGDAKTSHGSAFVPTTQSVHGVKSSLFSGDSTSKAEVVPPQKSIFSYNTPISSVSNAPTVILSVPSATVSSTEPIQKPLFTTKTSNTANAAKFVFGAPTSNVATSSASDTSPKLGFSFANLSTTLTKAENSTTSVSSNASNIKSPFGTATPVASSSTFSFKSLDNSKSLLSHAFPAQSAATKPATTTVFTPVVGKTSEVPSGTSAESKTITIAPNIFAPSTTMSFATTTGSSHPVQVVPTAKVVEISKVITTTSAAASAPLPTRIGTSVTITPVTAPAAVVSHIQMPPAVPPATTDTTTLEKTASKSVSSPLLAATQVITPPPQPKATSPPEISKASIFSPVTVESSSATTTAPSMFSAPATTASVFASPTTVAPSIFGGGAPFAGGTQQPFSLFAGSTQQPVASSSSIFGGGTQKSMTPSTTSNVWSIFGGNANTTTSPFGFTAQSTSPPSGDVAKPVAIGTTQSSLLGTTIAPSLFSVNTTNAATSIIQPSSIFGTSPIVTAPTSTQSSLFGSTNVPGATATPSIFASGTSTAQPSVFGAAAASTAQSPIFGSAVVTTAPQSSIFGSPTTKITAPATQASVFASASLTTTASPAPAFGTSAAIISPTPPAPAFGVSTTQTPVFGTPTASPSGSIFGASSITTADSIFPAIKSTAVGAFGSPPATFSTASAPAQSFFTPSSSTTSSMFGQPAAFGSGSIFSSPTSSSNTGSVFGGSSAPSTNVFGGATATTNAAFGSVFGGSAGTNASTSPFGSSSDTFRFATTTGPNTSSVGSGFGFNKQAFSSFGSNSTTTDTNSLSFGGLGLSTSSPSNVFGGGGGGGAGSNSGSGFGQNPFSRGTNQEQQKSPFSGGSIFGSSPATTSSPSSSIFGGTSPFSKSTPAFGGPATFGSTSAFGQQTSTFGQSAFGGGGNSVFGNASQPGPFSRGAQPSVNQSGFGAAPVFGTTPPAFGSSSPGAFGAAPAFGATPAFGMNSNFNAPNKPFSAGTDTFASSNQQSPTFANLANQTTLGFGSLAQQSQTPTSQSTFSGGSSFSNWR